METKFFYTFTLEDNKQKVIKAKSYWQAMVLLEDWSIKKFGCKPIVKEFKCSLSVPMLQNINSLNISKAYLFDKYHKFVKEQIKENNNEVYLDFKKLGVAKLYVENDKIYVEQVVKQSDLIKPIDFEDFKNSCLRDFLNVIKSILENRFC